MGITGFLTFWPPCAMPQLKRNTTFTENGINLVVIETTVSRSARHLLLTPCKSRLTKAKDKEQLSRALELPYGCRLVLPGGLELHRFKIIKLYHQIAQLELSINARNIALTVGPATSGIWNDSRCRATRCERPLLPFDYSSRARQWILGRLACCASHRLRCAT